MIYFKEFNEAVMTINEIYSLQQIQDSSVALYRHALEVPDSNGEQSRLKNKTFVN